MRKMLVGIIPNPYTERRCGNGKPKEKYTDEVLRYGRRKAADRREDEAASHKAVYRKSPDKEKYLRGHESEIILFEAAARALKEMQIKKLPDLAALRKEYRSLNDRKTKLYEDYRQAKKQMQEYGVVKKNVDSILYPSQSRAREQER